MCTEIASCPPLAKKSRLVTNIGLRGRCVFAVLAEVLARCFAVWFPFVEDSPAVSGVSLTQHAVEYIAPSAGRLPARPARDASAFSYALLIHTASVRKRLRA